MLWEGGWEWARLTKSKYISIEVTCPPPPPPPPYLLLISILLPLPVRSRPIDHSSPPVVFALKSRRFVRSCPKKVEKTSSENTTFENSEHPYRTCGSPGGLFLFSVPPLRQFCLLKPIIPLRAVPKKSKKRQAKTLLLKIRSTPIALAALPADFSIFSVPPLCQFSFENQ